MFKRRNIFGAVLTIALMMFIFAHENTKAYALSLPYEFEYAEGAYLITRDAESFGNGATITIDEPIGLGIFVCSEPEGVTVHCDDYIKNLLYGEKLYIRNGVYNLETDDSDYYFSGPDVTLLLYYDSDTHRLLDWEGDAVATGSTVKAGCIFSGNAEVYVDGTLMPSIPGDEESNRTIFTFPKNVTLTSVTSGDVDIVCFSGATAFSPSMKAVNESTATLSGWEQVNSFLMREDVKSLEAVDGKNADLLHLDITNSDKKIPAEVLESLKKSALRGLHVYLGDGTAVTFKRGETVIPEIVLDLSLSVKREDGIITFSFSKNQILDGKITIHAVVEKNCSYSLLMWNRFGEGELDGVIFDPCFSDSEGRICFDVDATCTYVLIPAY